MRFRALITSLIVLLAGVVAFAGYEVLFVTRNVCPTDDPHCGHLPRLVSPP